MNFINYLLGGELYSPPKLNNPEIDQYWQTDLDECLCFLYDLGGILTLKATLGEMLFAYSKDGVNWTIIKFENNQWYILINGAFLELLTNIFRIEYDSPKFYIQGVNLLGTTSLQFGIHSGRVTGNIMSLIGRNLTVIPSNACFKGLFENCFITEVPRLPATTLTPNCYELMFKGCERLIKAPDILPAVYIADYCYSGMFDGCVLITEPPIISAEETKPHCFEQMFLDCHSLQKTPELLVGNTAEEYACKEMFCNCFNLTQVSNFPFTLEIKERGCRSMFENCTSLTAPVKKLPAMTLGTNAYYAMYRGCTSIDRTPYLPATTLPNGVYYSMFEGCTNLVYTLEDLASTLGNNECYKSMFLGCTSLTYAPKLYIQDGRVLGGKVTNMFKGCTSLIWAAYAWTNWGLTTAQYYNDLFDGIKTNGTYYGTASSYYIPSTWTRAGVFASTINRPFDYINSDGDLVHK